MSPTMSAGGTASKVSTVGVIRRPPAQTSMTRAQGGKSAIVSAM
jgi:hypothetical protein